MSPPSPLRRVATVLLLGVALAVGGGVGPAAAHSDDGVMEIVTLESPTPLEVRIEVGIVYANDDDIASEAEVTVTATGDDGTSVGPIDVPNADDGLYETTFEVPTAGTWSVTATSTGPVAEATGSVEVATGGSTSAPTTEPTTATSAGTTATSTEESTTTAAPGTDAPSTTAAAGTGEQDDDDGSVLPIVALAVLAVAAIAAVVVIARRGGNPPSGPADGDPIEPGPDGETHADTDGSTP